ncbi:ABC-three component system protein [Corynebacterium belfantii]|uniref:ABC-three component system protein n=1 Tax=Corynebacterium belfantii TaxID=2014537 RepID=UPI003530E50D
MARPVSPQYALGALLQVIRPALSLKVKTDAGFVRDFFDHVCDTKLCPKPMPKGEGNKNTVKGGWFKGVDRGDLGKYWRGERPLPEPVASRILPAIRKPLISEILRQTSTFDAMSRLASKLNRDGLEIKNTQDLCDAIYTLLYDVIEANSKRQDLLKDSDSVHTVIPGIHTYELSTGRISGNSLQIGTSSIPISPAPPVPEELAPEEVYVQRALEAIAEKLGKEPVSFEHLKSLPGKYAKFLVHQRTHYWSAVGRHRNLQEIRPDDGDEQFERIKDDLDDFLETTWMSDVFPDGYERMLKTLGQASHYQVGGSVLTSIPDLFATSHKQGMTHMLVNEDRIEWSS